MSPNAGTSASARSTYTFDTSGSESSDHFAGLERFLDPITTARLTPPVVGEGRVCWEIGAGGGSIARLLSRIVGARGRVVATDLDTSRLASAGNLTVLTHDVREGPVSGGPFDLIHARLLLHHFPERRQVLRDLVAALAPGGWLVIEDYDTTDPRGRVLTAPPAADVALFHAVLAAIIVEVERHGADLSWGRNIHGAMAEAGLVDLDTRIHLESWVGDPTGAMLYDINSRQLQPQLEAAGLTADQLTRFRRLTRDPRFAALSYEFVSTVGRKPR